jgi:hypothetical protein
MKRQNKFSTEQQHELVAGQQQAQQQTQEFANAEELLRFDARNTIVPPEIARRLQQSAAALPQPKRSWVKRLFGG